MNTQVSKSEIDGAKAYNNLHVPALFQQWAPLMVEAAELDVGDSVLDVACGTGVLAREAKQYVGDSGSITGLDAAAGMLAVATQLEPSIEWKQGLAESLPFKDNAFDAVVCQFGLMFFRDRSLALSEMLRVLKPQCTVTVAVWDSLENSQAYPLAVALLERRAGREAAQALQAPFVLGETNALRALFEKISPDSISITTHIGKARFPSIKAMVEADLRGWLPVMGVFLNEEVIQSILLEAEDVLAKYVTPNGAVEFDAPAHIITAKKPS